MIERARDLRELLKVASNRMAPTTSSIKGMWKPAGTEA
jgi:hypothetical protein